MQLHADGNVNYFRISEIPEEQRAEFSKWLEGQTRPLIEGLEPQDAVWPWDYNRWKLLKLTGVEVWD